MSVQKNIETGKTPSFQSISHLNPGVNARGFESMPIVMAEWVSINVGTIWPFFAGFIGGLGAFIAGSNTVSNLMFSLFQHGVAEELMIAGSIVVALQVVGAAAGNMICIHNVVATSATVGLRSWKQVLK